MQRILLFGSLLAAGVVGGGLLTLCLLGGQPAKPVQTPDGPHFAQELPAPSLQGTGMPIQTSPLATAKVSSVTRTSSPGTSASLPSEPVSSISSNQPRANAVPTSGKAANRPVSQSTSSGGSRPSGMTSSSANPVSTTISSAAPVQNQKTGSDQAVELPLPAAFVPAPAGEQTTAAQQAAVKNLQQQFNSAIAPYAQTATDAVYADQWMTAQWLSDQMFKTTMGQQAFLARERQANMHGLPSQP